MTKMPLKTILVKGERYHYAGNMSNTKTNRETNTEFNRENGKKTIFRKDIEDKSLAMYISNKTFEKLIKKYGRW